METEPQVLIVDDDPGTLLALRRAIASPAWAVVTAASGAEALRVIEREELAVVLLDMRMPGMDGPEVVSRMKADPRGRSLPVIFMTAASGDMEEVRRAYSHGCVDYMHKPLDVEIVRGKVATFVELLRQRRSERSARQAEAEARVALEAREELLASVSHELKSPLTTLTLSVGRLRRMLAAQEASPESQKVLGLIGQASDQMHRLIEDLLDLARVRSGMLEVVTQPELPGSLLAECVTLNEPLAARKAITLHSDVHPDAAAHPVACDRRRVLQILSNLVGNAIKFTPEQGTITLRAEPRGGSVAFSVIDAGPGIPPELLARIFEPHTRGPGESPSWAGNLGLGLSIAKALVEAHGGAIRAQSEPGRGSAFSFTLGAG